MTALALVLAVPLTVIAALHAYWGVGGVWPGTDEASCARAIAGFKGITTMPSTGASFAVAAALVFALLVALALGGWFAQEDWLADERNQDIAKRFLAAMLEANRALAADRSLIDAILVRDFGMPSEIASGIPMPLGVDSILAEPGHYGVLISELEKTGMIEAGSVTTDDVIKTIQYE